MIERRAPAKLNLGLEILRRRDDGYHEIETIFLPLRLADRLAFRRAATGVGIRITVAGAELPVDRENLVYRAAERACGELRVPADLLISLEKQVPIAAGLGGGSSDAAATLLGLELLFGEPLGTAARQRIALQLGADVPFFLAPRPAVGRGVGERLETLAGVPEMFWVLVAFPFPISTAKAYQEAGLELTLPRSPTSIGALLGPSGLLVSPRNDLEASAVRRHPEIRAARRALESFGALATGMTGSGPTVFGRFANEQAARQAAERVEVPAGARTIATSSPGSASAESKEESGWGVAKR
ncbi:MAG: 4-(cytidine 5'-diphospho)-2-C-methyl-D-erythritol kinase [Myxococcota bacterium]